MFDHQKHPLCTSLVHELASIPHVIDEPGSDRNSNIALGDLKRLIGLWAPQSDSVYIHSEKTEQ